MVSPSDSGSLAFEGLRVRDKTGADTTSATVVVSRKGVKLSGTKGVLGNFPFQSITSWSHAADDALSLVVTVGAVRREVILAGPPDVVTAVLQAIDSTVNDILQDMTEPVASVDATPAQSPAEPTQADERKNDHHVSKTDATIADAKRAAERAAERTEHTERALAARERAIAARERAVAEAEVANVLRDSPGASRNGSPSDESKIATAAARARDATKDAEAARLEATAAKAATAAAEARVVAAEARARLNQPGAETSAPTETKNNSALEQSLKTIETLRGEVATARAEAEEARAAAGRLSSSAAVNANAAAAYYRSKDGHVRLGSTVDAELETSEQTETDMATAAATAVAMCSHAEAEGLRIELTAVHAELRKLKEEKDAAALDAERAWQKASETHENLRALSSEFDLAKKAAADVAIVTNRETKSRELSISVERERFDARLNAANEAARSLGVEKGELEVEAERLRRELERSFESRSVLEMHVKDAGEQVDRLRAELAVAVAAAADAKDEANAAYEEAATARAELEALRGAADDIGERLDQHARESEAEATALTVERDRLVDALRSSTAHLDAAERRAAEANACAAAADGAREGVAAGAKRAARLAATDVETMRKVAAAAEKKCENAVLLAEEARDVAQGLRIELDEARAARDAFAAEAREALAQRDASERRTIDALSAKRDVDEMMVEAEEALHRANQAERDAALEVASLREESELLARHVDRQRRDEDASRRRREVEVVVERLGVADREVLQQTNRSAATMEGLERSVAELASSVRNGETSRQGQGNSQTPQPLTIIDRGDENIDPVGGLLTLSQPASRRYTPWFPEVDTPAVRKHGATSVVENVSAARDSPGSVTAPKRTSIIADAALEADAALAAARSIRDSRERGVPSASGSGRLGEFLRLTSVVQRDAVGDSNDTLEELELKAKARLERSTDEARASLDALRVAQNREPGDWQVRLQQIEAENERTRQRLDKAREGRSAEQTSEDPKPRDVSPPQPWR